MAPPNLNRIFQPQAIAVIGATSRCGAVGHTVLNNLLQAEYPGRIYPVNPKRTELLGLRVFRDIADTPTRPDLAVICTPAATTPEILRACGQAGVGGVVILSAGCREAGRAGQKLEEQLRAEARCWPGMRIIGPNCLGVLSPRARLNASFAAAMPLTGNIAFVSQSGALCAAILDWSLSANVGFSHFVSIGNAMDVEFSDLINYFADDPHTSSIVLYVESITKARDFMSAAQAFSRDKPIVVYKAGRFAASAQAAASHTGALAGVDAVYEAAFNRAGAVRVYEAEDMFDCAELLAARRLSSGPRLAVVTNAGGPAVMATDTLLERGGALAELSSQTLEQLSSSMPPHWSHGNPVDVLGDANPERFAQAAKAVLDDPRVDAVLVILTPQAMTDSTATAEQIASLYGQTRKPILTAWMGGDAVRKGRQVLAAAGVPTFDLPDRAVCAFSYLMKYGRYQQSLQQGPEEVCTAADVDRPAARALIDRLIGGANRTLSEGDSKNLLAAYGLSVTATRLAASAAEAAAIGSEIGYPVVMKIQSPDISHKSDTGGVEIGVSDSVTAQAAYERIVNSVHRKMPSARIEGVTVQPMVLTSAGVELILGAKCDPVFGPVVLVGAGGVTAEVQADRVLELPPLSRRLARRMLESLRIWPLLCGYRGRPAIDVDSLVDALMKLSQLVADIPELLEFDANPVLATPTGVVVLDARVVLKPAAAR